MSIDKHFSPSIEETSKPFYLSKTLWAQALFLLAALFPAMQEWLAGNPVGFAAVWGALNVLIRFATSGKVSLGKGDVTGVVRGLALFVGLSAALALSCGLSSCAWQKSGEVRFHDPETGAKGVIVKDESGYGWSVGKLFEGGRFLGFGGRVDRPAPEVNHDKGGGAPADAEAEDAASGL